jgi:hypothetical protein
VKKNNENYTELTLNKSLTIGIGTVTLDKENEQSQLVGLSPSLLKTVLKIMDELDVDENDRIYFRIQKDYPIFISNSKTARCGLILAPKVEEE